MWNWCGSLLDLIGGLMAPKLSTRLKAQWPLVVILTTVAATGWAASEAIGNRVARAESRFDRRIDTEVSATTRELNMIHFELRSIRNWLQTHIASERNAGIPDRSRGKSKDGG